MTSYSNHNYARSPRYRLLQYWCYHFVFKGVTHDRSATQNRTPFLHCFKYTFRNFNPYFAQKRVQFSLKKNPLFLHFKYTFSNTTLFQPNQEQTDHSFTSIFHRNKNLHSFFQISSTQSNPLFFKYRVHFMFSNIVLKKKPFFAKFGTIMRTQSRKVTTPGLIITSCVQKKHVTDSTEI